MISTRSFLFFTFLITSCSAHGTEIKVAVLDSLQSQKLASEKYQKNYFTGLELANVYGKKHGVQLKTQYFEYGKGDLDVLTKADEVKKWNPDIVIGPRSSGKFLMLKDKFNDVMVVSPLATSSEVASLPKNFYSITPSNADSAVVMSSYIKKNLKNKDVISFTELDCKSCVDYTKTLAADKSLHFRVQSLLSSEIESISPEKIIHVIKSGELILLSATSYAAGVLLSKIVNADPNITRTFLGTDEWGSFKASYVGKVPMQGDFVAYRLVPWSLSINTKDMLLFRDLSKNLREVEIDEISFVSFSLGKSIIDSYIKGKSKKLNTKEALLSGFEINRRKDSLYAKPKNYSVFRRTKNSETFEKQVP